MRRNKIESPLKTERKQEKLANYQIQDQYTDMNSCNPKQELEVLSKNNKKLEMLKSNLKNGKSYVTISFQF